jgi:hypothetical protein
MYVVHRFIMGLDFANHNDFERYAGWMWVDWLDNTENGKLYKEHFAKPVTLRYNTLLTGIGVEVIAPLTDKEAVFWELIRQDD